MAVAHSARVGAFQREWVFTAFIGQHQKVLKLLREKSGTFRVVKGQCRQGIDNAVAARDTPVIRLHANNGDDNLAWHSSGCRYAGQRVGMLFRKVDTATNSLVCNKDFPILVPGLGFFRGSGNRIENALLSLGSLQHLLSPGAINAFCHSGIKHLLSLRSIEIIRFTERAVDHQQARHWQEKQFTHDSR